MQGSPAIEAIGVAHRYGSRAALDGVSLQVEPGELFALLGPNGSGKSTLFRLLSTLLPLEHGTLRIAGHDVRSEPALVRRALGVVFQSPSIDKKLSVYENLWHQGRLYGLSRDDIAHRARVELERFGLTDRAADRCDTLSGGQQRRVELAKALLHRPPVLLLDEPSTGLDPLARHELACYLRELTRDGVAVALTTHLIEEAEMADRVAILNRGRLVACDLPDVLRQNVGGDAVWIDTARPEEAARQIATTLQLAPRVIDGRVRLELADAHAWVARLVEALPGQVQSISVSRPSLADVFLARTGHGYHVEEVFHGDEA